MLIDCLLAPLYGDGERAAPSRAPTAVLADGVSWRNGRIISGVNLENERPDGAVGVPEVLRRFFKAEGRLDHLMVKLRSPLYPHSLALR